MKGTAQSDRLLSALLPDYVKVDERNIADMLALGAEYAKLISFVTVSGQKTESWEAFLLSDPSVFLAVLAATDLQAIEREHLGGLAIAEREEHDGETLIAMGNHLVQLAQKVDEWYKQAIKFNTTLSGEPLGMERELEHSIRTTLAPKLRELMFWANLSNVNLDNLVPHENDNYGFHSIWALNTKYEPKMKEVPTYVDILKSMRLIYRNYHGVLTHLVERANVYLEHSLNEGGTHPPHTALYITFLKLYRYAQEHLNEYTQRHLDFYYRQVLRQSVSDAKADQTYVCFNLAEHLPQFTIEAGLRVSSSAQPNSVFETTQKIKLNQAKIGALRTLFVSKNQNIGIGSSYQLVSNIYAAQDANSLDGKGKPFSANEAPSFPTFGEEQLNIPVDKRQLYPADFGFAISDAVLALNEGHRQVIIQFKFETSTINTLSRLIKDISRNERISRENAFFKIFQNAFIIQVSGESGWLNVSSYNIQLSETPEQYFGDFVLSFELATAFPPLVPYNAEVLGAELDTTLPTIKFLLNPESTVYGYSFLREAEIEFLNIKVSVSGLKRLTLYNELGRLDADKPFQLFGPQPKLGSFLLIGNEEVFCKTLSSIRFNWEWFNLPAMGLDKYYEAYDTYPGAEGFSARLSALSSHVFEPQDVYQQAEVPLFSLIDGQNTSLSDYNSFVVEDLEPYELKPQPHFKLPDVFNGQVATGFWRLELSSPPDGFGHDRYPTLFAEVMADNARGAYRLAGVIPTGGSSQRPVPNPPFTPQVRRLSIDYTAESHLVMRPTANVVRRQLHSKIFHLHPFGRSTVFKDGRAAYPSLLPQYNDIGYLFIGLDNILPSNEVSLLFHFKDHYNAAADTLLSRPPLRWSYLAEGERWVDFMPEHIIADTTEGFSTSGMVRLSLPSDIALGSELLSDTTKRWICVSVKREADAFPPLAGVHTQAALVKRILVADEDEEEAIEFSVETLSPQQLDNLVTYQPEIDSVFQPLPSFGGRTQETETTFITRVSERLRHKGRGVQLWDIERLVLEQFPQIRQVKIITSQDYPEKVVPVGTIKIVVVPFVEQTIEGEYIEPKVSASILMAIRRYLEARMSPFVTIELMNPVYEKLKISCGVIFKDENYGGAYLETLNRDIRRLVSPWLFDSNQNLDLGGTLDKNTLLAQIERLPYVKFITRFSMVQVFHDDNGNVVDDTARNNNSPAPALQASKPWSVFLPLYQHPIAFLERENYSPPDVSGVDTALIGVDFVIRGEEQSESEPPVVAPTSPEKEAWFFITIDATL